MRPRTATVTVTPAAEKDVPDLLPLENGTMKPMLFTTHTCPKCKVVKAMFDEQSFDYDLIYADDTPELAQKLDIVNVPTLVIPTTDGVNKYTDVPAIRQYMNDCKGIKA